MGNEVRDWSLVTGRGGGGTKREGDESQVLPLEKIGGGGGGNKFKDRRHRSRGGSG